MAKKNNSLIILAIVITALITGLGVYIWQRNAVQTEKENLQKQIATLEEQVKTLEKQVDTLPKNPQGQVLARANEVLLLLHNKDLDKLAAYIHPDKGVRFSPYAYVDPQKDLIFTAEQIKKAFSDQKEYVWGNYDGTGDPIKLSFEGYFRKFIYDVEFINAREISYNHPLGKGNTINNAAEIYPNANIVEYHFPGIDPKYEGMDWRSLRLVLEEKNSNWYLVGIIHDQWTI
jgi:cell division protein FtsB